MSVLVLFDTSAVPPPSSSSSAAAGRPITTFHLNIPVPAVANAIDERNELLCGTGFFTNIYQYKCTEIGDIENEGKSKDLSSSELSSVSSLKDKLESTSSSSTSSSKGSKDADSTTKTTSSGDSMTTSTK